jgi:hypothetical protein
MIINGLKVAERLPLNDLEKEVARILKESGIEFVTHASLDTIKRKINVDFIIPNEKEPKVIIEAFKFHVKNGNFNGVRTRVGIVDHRFQLIKLSFTNVKTTMIIKLDGELPVRENVKELLELEVINTDGILINEEIENLPSIVEKILKK